MSITMARMEEILESFNAHDVDFIVANFDENGEFLMAAGPEPHGERFVGRQAIGEVLRQRFSAIWGRDPSGQHETHRPRGRVGGNDNGTHSLRLTSRGARMVQLRRLSGTHSHPPISLLGRLHLDGRAVAALHTVRLALGR